MIEKIKTFGFPPEKYKFTGEFSTQEQGFYKAKRNKIIKFVPIYKSISGKTVIDMEQAQ